VDTYPCPACGGVADSSDGCRSCGRPPDSVAAALARLNQAVAGIDAEAERIAVNRSQLMARRARLNAQRAALTNALARKLAQETRVGRGRTSAGSDTRTTGPVPTQRRPAAPGGPPAAPAETGDGDLPLGVETSTRSVRNTLLTLGGVLLGVGAIVFTGVAFTTESAGERTVTLVLSTTLALAVPVLLARRGLTATAETVAAFGFLLVLLDGYAAYVGGLAGLREVPPPLYAAILCGLVAGVATAYRLATQLVAPQFTALLAAQPLLPLIGLQLGLGRTGFAAIAALVGAQNLVALAIIGRRKVAVLNGTAQPVGTPWRWRRALRDVAWALFGIALAASGALSVVSLVRASTVADAGLAGLALVLGAAVGVAGAQLDGRVGPRQIATGAATLAVIGALSRIDALAWPQYTLVLTAALAAGTAIAAGALPAEIRRGPQLGSMVAAGLTAVAVTIGTMATATATVKVAVDPRWWAADLSRYGDRVLASSWQVPAAAVLLAVVAALATPSPWRGDALAVGSLLAVFALPGTGVVTWWAVPMLDLAAATTTIVAGLYARNARSALLRAGVGTLLALHAAATGLARPGLTAAVLVVLTVVGVTVAASASSARFGPYADRISDVAGGLATVAGPMAVGTLAHLAGASGRVLLAVTLLAGAVGLAVAAVSQVGGRAARTATAGGALLAAIGCLVLALGVDGTSPADIALGAGLVAVALVTATARAFEVEPTGLIDAVESVPAAVGALTEAIEGETEVHDAGRPPVRRRRVSGVFLGAAGATALLILALARLVAVAVPGFGLVTTTAMVLLTSIFVRTLPEPWRPGPRAGGLVVGGAAFALAAGVAIGEAVSAVTAAVPWWSGPSPDWPHGYPAWYGWQVPATLLLASAAAAALLPAPRNGDAAFVALSLAGLAAPLALGLAWWSPAAIAGALAVVAGLGAGITTSPDGDRQGRERLSLAAFLGLYATTTAMATPMSTAVVLSGIIAAGALVAAVAYLRGTAAATVPGVASAAAVLAAPGAAATIAVAAGASGSGVLTAAMTVSAGSLLALLALRVADVSWRAYPAFGVAAGALGTALASAGDRRALQVWAAVAAVIGVAAAASVRPDSRTAPVLGATGAPAALIAAAGSAPAWVAALFGPYRTLDRIWTGQAVTATPADARPAMATLALLTVFAAGAALALTDPQRQPSGAAVFAAVLAPLAALALIAPTAFGAPPEVVPWVAFAIAIAAGVGAAFGRPTQPAAIRLLRSIAGVVCALWGAAGIAGSLATRTSTLVALSITVVAAGLAALVGRDPAVRMVAWIVASAASLALPVTAFAAAGRPLRPSAFAILAVCGVLVGVAWFLARGGRRPPRSAEAAVVELCAVVGAAFALLLTLEDIRYAAAVLTIWGVLLGVAALRRDRPASRRAWLVRAACAAELGACWLLLYDAAVGLPEAYTLPFAFVALLAGAYELKRRPDLSSWVAYSPALVAGFLPSLALVLVDVDPNHLLRRGLLFVGAVVTVIVGSWRRRQAPVITGSAVAVVVALYFLMLLWISGTVAGYLLFALAGLVLIVLGAVYEKRLRGALRKMS